MRELGIDLDEVELIGRDVFLGKNGTFRAFGHAHGAVDAFVGIDCEEVGAFVEAVNRTDVHTVSALAVDAGFANNVSHFLLVSRMGWIFGSIRARVCKRPTN